MKPFDIDFKLDCKKADVLPQPNICGPSNVPFIWPIPFHINVFSALKGSWFYFLFFSVYIDCSYLILSNIYIDVCV